MKTKQIIKQLMETIRTIKMELEYIVLNLPDNPNIHRINSNTFTISSKNLGNNWSPFYHDYKAQYKAIIEVINKSQAENIIHNLETMISTGLCNKRKLNPQVIDHLKNLVETC